MSDVERGTDARSGQLPARADLVSAIALADGMRDHRRTGAALGETLVSCGYVRAERVARARAREHGLAGVAEARDRRWR